MTGLIHAFTSASAQTACAAFSCPEMTDIVLTVDAGLLLASFAILLMTLPVRKLKAAGA